jgi:hypothetical protein
MGIVILAERAELLAGDDRFQFQSFRTRANPLAGPDLPGSVIVILRQMLVEILLGIRQILMRYGRKHGTDFG